MQTRWQLEVFGGNERLRSFDIQGAVEIGRQDRDAGEEHLSCTSPPGSNPTVRITAIADSVANVSRKHALVEPVGPSRLKLTNLTERLPIVFRDGSTLAPRASKEMSLPAEFAIGPVAIHIELPPAGETIQMLDPVASTATMAEPGLQFPSGVLGTQDSAALFRWLAAAQGVLQSAVSAQDFYIRAARALVDLVEMDSGRVFEFKGGAWCAEPAAEVFRMPGSGSTSRPSRRVLESIRQEKKVCFQVPAQLTGDGSVADVEALVAAPVIDGSGNVVAALYGDRRSTLRSSAPPTVTELEARLVELFAGGVATGLARVAQEKEALKARIQFEQFFSPELAAHLTREPDLLVARDMLITAVFCDIRGFSRVSEKHGPKITMEWVGDVMDTLSDCILAHGGVVVDYIGDEVFAMFGAPEAKPDHADRACRAGLAMIAALSRIDERWLPTLGELTTIGVGINTGPASVGNTGSSRRFKYGALGNTVNLASRVQGVNKYLKTRALFTDSTRAALTGQVTSRKLCRVEVVNIKEPVGLNELAAGSEPGFDTLKAGYEEALAALEEGSARRAARLIGGLLETYPEDGPSLRLLGRAVEAINDPALFKPVWVLPGK